MIKYQNEFITIAEVGETPKTKIYKVYQNTGSLELGTIKWDAGWRKYVYQPIVETQTKYDEKCLFAMAEFIRQANEEHKEKLTRK